MTVSPESGHLARQADGRWLASALRASREDTLATFAQVERALDRLTVPQRETLNPPLWELGHIGWFQECWIARNPLRFVGATADPGVQRQAGVRPSADALYDSDAAATRADLVELSPPMQT